MGKEAETNASTDAEKKREAREEVRELGQAELKGSGQKIQLISIIGEIEGHESLSGGSKTTKYEHILPKLAEIEDSPDTDGVLILENSTGGSVESGLAIAEMIASLSKPTVSLVIGDGHSISVPIAVAADYSFIVPSATMIVHPVRASGMVVGVRQTFVNMEQTQDRITSFIERHSHITKKRIEELMLDVGMLVKDVGTILDGEAAVQEGLIDRIGGISDAVQKLHELIDASRKK